MCRARLCLSVSPFPPPHQSFVWSVCVCVCVLSLEYSTFNLWTTVSSSLSPVCVCVCVDPMNDIRYRQKLITVLVCVCAHFVTKFSICLSCGVDRYKWECGVNRMITMMMMVEQVRVLWLHECPIRCHYHYGCPLHCVPHSITITNRPSQVYCVPVCEWVPLCSSLLPSFPSCVLPTEQLTRSCCLIWILWATTTTTTRCCPSRLHCGQQQ